MIRMRGRDRMRLGGEKGARGKKETEREGVEGVKGDRGE